MASSPASTARPIVTSASSIRCPGSRWASKAPNAGPQRERRTDRGPHRPDHRRRAARLGPPRTRPSGRRAGCWTGTGRRGAGSRARRAARCRRSPPATAGGPRRRTGPPPRSGRRRWPRAPSSRRSDRRRAPSSRPSRRPSPCRTARRERASRLRDGTSSGRPSAMSRRLLAPSWTSWAAMPPPWRVDVADQPAQPGQVGVVGRRHQAGVVGSRRVGDRHRPDEDQPGAAAGPGLEPGGLRVADGAVGLAQVGAHRAHGDAVAAARASPSRPGESRCGKALTTARRCRCRCRGPWG